MLGRAALSETDAETTTPSFWGIASAFLAIYTKDRIPLITRRRPRNVLEETN